MSVISNKKTNLHSVNFDSQIRFYKLLKGLPWLYIVFPNCISAIVEMKNEALCKYYLDK